MIELTMRLLGRVLGLGSLMRWVMARLVMFKRERSTDSRLKSDFGGNFAALYTQNISMTGKANGCDPLSTQASATTLRFAKIDYIFAKAIAFLRDELCSCEGYCVGPKGTALLSSQE